MKMRFLSLAPLCAGALLLSSCVSIGSGAEPPEQLITLTPAAKAPAGSAREGTIDSAIFVFEPEVEDRLDVKRVPVQIDASSLAYLQNAFYVDRPARLFQSLLAETLRVTSGRLVIQGTDPGLPRRTRLYGKLVEMGYDAQAMSVTVTFDAVRVDPEGKINAQRFSSTVPGISADAAYVAPALNNAANEVAGSVAEWMNGFS
ncbi:ABC-type transport auxiliary lipoprotein family protein [Croceicoccus sp. Ery15]|uniref:ABC-type transport auxiliary lipoprotein family protein n=1 Tax=Croceicoccus sp. Ery15 TaxID=1703338 RepID=UPI001E29ECCC|nr:ABC-type transport auxiliary lipoprotein family protein [Croceicoccus sp. Ery15]